MHTKRLESDAAAGAASRVGSRGPHDDRDALHRQIALLILALVSIPFANADAQNLTSQPAPTPSAHYRHAIFENSVTAERYYHSEGRQSGGSGITLVRGRLPVDVLRFRSAPNSLRLQWWSATGGHWEATIRVDRWRNRAEAFVGSFLSLWLQSPEGITAGQLPRLRVADAGGRHSSSLDIAARIRDLPAGEWVEVRVPLDSIHSVEADFDPRRLGSLSFLQGGGAGGYELLVDDIRIDSTIAGSASPPSPPQGLRATGYERHVDLRWEPNVENVARYEIHRSDDGIEYRPVGIQAAGITRFADWIGEPGRTVHYRVAVRDRAGRLSSPGPAVTAETRSMTDDELLTMVQEAHFRYYWEGAHPVAGIARENIPGNDDLVATGASGFGIMAMLVGAERGFITRSEAAQRMLRIVRFLERADRFHGAWPHFLDGRTGEVIPLFGPADNGSDLVETSFLVQGLLAARQYFQRADSTERAIVETITDLWEDVEWDWFRRTPESPFLFWHWSPDQAWAIDHPLIGFNETMITYVLAIASPTHAVPADMYYSGWASQLDRAVEYRRGWGRTSDGDHYANGNEYHGIPLPVGVGSGGPLFFTHYSFLGLDPEAVNDRWTNYLENNTAIARINLAYSMANPGDYRGYGANAWGLTASDDPWGYAAHEPESEMDNGTLAPTGALGSFPYTPEASLAALKHYYRDLGETLWTEYGFRDAFNLTEGWFAPITMGLNQAPITVMIENWRTGLVWRLFMANPEIGRALAAIEREGRSRR